MYREALGLPVKLRPGRAVVALCRWEDYNYRLDGGTFRDIWTPRDEPATACRASLADEKLNVWLPQGARITLRAVRWYRERGLDPMTGDYTHVYGSHERYTRSRIRITLTELPNPRPLAVMLVEYATAIYARDLDAIDRLAGEVEREADRIGYTQHGQILALHNAAEQAAEPK